MKKLCDLSKTLLGNVKKQKLPESDSNQVMAEAFNTFCINKILKIRSSMKNSQSSDSHSHIKENLCSNLGDTLETFKPTDVDEVKYIVNKSLAEGLFPSNLKHADITPLLKKENLDKEVLKNYKPVSNMPFLSKVIEKVVEDCLRTQNDILSSINERKMVALVI